MSDLRRAPRGQYQYPEPGPRPPSGRRAEVAGWPSPRRPRPRRRHPMARRLAAGATAVATVVAVLGAASIVGAWRNPGNADFKAKWADWLRAHHASLVVNPLEHWYYSRQAPAAGGRPSSLNVVPHPDPNAIHAAPAPSHLAAPRSIPLIVSPFLPSEGQWQPSGPLVNGHPAMYVAEYRADTIYTSQITTAVWIDPTVLRIRLVPGAQEPGGTWVDPPYLSGDAAARAVAASTAGFVSRTPKAGSTSPGTPPCPSGRVPPRWSLMTPAPYPSARGEHRSL
jgi:hypothetical protein